MSRMTWGVYLGAALRVGVLLALLPAASYGLGLGPIKVKSALNETLDAEIAFISVTDRELKDLQVGLAPANAFKVAGIERHPRLSAIQFRIERDDNGRPYLHLTTRFPYPEPYLHILVQAEWTVGGSVGRLRREYTALIDPPFLTASKPNGIRAPRTPAFARAEAEPELSFDEITPSGTGGPELLIEEEPEPQVAMAKEEEPELLLEEEPEPKTMPSSRSAAGKVMDEPELDLESVAEDTLLLSEADSTIGEADLLGPPDHLLPGGTPAWASTSSYRVKRGDTAYGIALKIRQDKSLTLEQVVVALYDSNPKAFFGNNTNNLRAGKILKIPEREIFSKRSRRSASRKFRAHYDSWQEYKLKLASARQPVSLGEPPVVAKAKPAAPKDIAKPKAIEKKKIVRKPAEKPKTVVAEKPKRKGMQIPPSRNGRKEELLRIVRANIDKKSKAAGKSAETESAKGKQQLKVKVDTLQGSQEVAVQPEAGAKAGKPKSIAPAKKRLLQIENADLAQTASSDAESKPTVVAKVAPESKPKKPVAVAKKRSKPVKRIKAPTPKEESIVDMLMGMVNGLLGNQFMLMIGGGLAVVGAAIGMLYMRRRRKSLSEFEESIL
ncbi:MAG: FimV/HubP family polar landmark protein, partial [Acidiferrobacterales bacterium]